MASSDVHVRMREDWNARAREDAHYYVAFGQRNQDDEGFFATGVKVLELLQLELKRGTPATGRARRILEIGCGPGRLMRPMSAHCGEIHGIDVSDEMVARARANLAGISHAHAHTGSGATLDQFADESFDFVYSYAVFQHIPSRDVVFSYLREVVRVLKSGGLARLQLNGLPKDATEYTTWAGIRISAMDIREFAAEYDLQLLVLDGLNTQYMWTTWRKAPPAAPKSPLRILGITNAHTSEPAVPLSGRFASASLWIGGLGDAADLNNIDLRIGGLDATATYLGPPEPDGLRQLNALIPQGLSAGITIVELNGVSRGLRLLPKPPSVPRVMSVTDGVDLLSEGHITSGTGKLIVEEFEPIENFSARIDDQPVHGIEIFCVDPQPPRHEVNFRIPDGLRPGHYKMSLYVSHAKKSTIDLIVS